MPGDEDYVILSIDRIGEVAIVECEGAIVRCEAACRLRNSVTSLEARIVVLDLSEVNMIDGNGLSMFLFLQQWAYHNGIQLKLFNPRWCVRERLEHASPIPSFDIASVDEMTAILANAGRRGLDLAA